MDQKVRKIKKKYGTSKKVEKNQVQVCYFHILLVHKNNPYFEISSTLSQKTPLFLKNREHSFKMTPFLVKLETYVRTHT